MSIGKTKLLNRVLIHIFCTLVVSFGVLIVLYGSAGLDESHLNEFRAEFETADLCPDPPVITFISGDGLNCEGDSDGNVLITVNGGTPIAGPYPYIFDWDWSESPENDSYDCSCPSGEFEDLTGLSAGIYYVTVTDAAGCTATAQAEVTEPLASITISANDVELDCFGDADGEITISVSGGTPNPFNGSYTYDWDWDGTAGNDDIGGPSDPTDDDQNPTNIDVGQYTLTVTDFLGCTAEVTISVTEPPELQASATSTDVECAGEASGDADLSVQGGTAPFSFDWDIDGTGDNDDQEDLIGVPAGTYSVTVTDDNGCTATATVDITEPSEAVTASLTGFDVTCFEQDNGSLDLTPGGGTGNYTFDWNNDGTGDNDDTEDLNNVPPGSYSVTVTDANGCTAVASFDISEPPELTGTLDETICAGSSIIVNGTTYDENNTSGTEVFTASNGCDSTVTVNISITPPPQTDFNYEACEGDGYSIVINGVTYDEGNESGTETLTTPEGCDSIVNIQLTFLPPVISDFTYSGCENDGYSVDIGGTIFDESNQTGQVVLTSASGCDSIINVSLSFAPPSESTIDNQGCQGDGFSVTINGTTYDESNPSGVEVITNNDGCDSTITIDLQFGEPSSNDISYQGCEGDGYSVSVGPTIFNEGNPSGTVVLVNADGCDSTVTVNLVFLPPVNSEIMYSGCSGDGYSVVVNGVTYDENNPNGQETMLSATGCDSIITIALEFASIDPTDLNYSGCEGDGYSVVVNGVTYDESNPTGQEVMQTPAGCDSVINIDLTFGQSSEDTFTHTGCEGDGFTILIGGQIFDENNPNGSVVLVNNAGCDSIVIVQLDFLPASEGEETYVGCSGDGYSVLVGGVVYNEAQPSGTEILTNINGCDSVVIIDLVFHPNSDITLEHVGCSGDGYFVEVNGTIYDESNPSGTEIMQTPQGCDSVVTIDLEFSDEIDILLDPTICQEGEIVVGGQVFDITNPSGSVSLTSAGGCDSIVNVDLSFYDISEGFETYTGCSGDGYFVSVGGTVFSEANPTGSVVIASVQGCDSIVNVDLNFAPLPETDFDTVLCAGEFIVINGTIYDASNPTGTEIFTGGTCDSIVNIVVDIAPTAQSTIEYYGCVGDGYSTVVNGTLYDEDNPSGTEQFSGGQGCDSVVTIDLQFYEEVEEFISHSGCIGDGYSIEVNGTTYDESNPQGIEFMQTQYGCDSIINIDLMFGDTVFSEFIYNGCQGDGYTVQIGNNTYSESNPEGEELFISGSGCDSLVTVLLNFEEPSVTDVNLALCQGDSLVVNGTVYNESNPSGTEVISTAACDSIVNIELTFNDAIITDYGYTGCVGDQFEVVINGTPYNETNTSGVEVLESQSGCDSIVNVLLIFEDCCQSIEDSIQASICDGDSYLFGNVELTQSGTYTDTIIDAIGPGCDSIVVLNLAVSDAIEEQIDVTICDGTEYDFHGQIISAPGMYSHEIPNGAASGCDSIVLLVMQVESEPEIDAGNGGTITCVSTTVNLTGTSSVADVLWSGPGIEGEATALSINATAPGWYFITGTSPNGCVAYDSVFVDIVDEVPALTVGPDGQLDCETSSVLVQVEVAGQNITMVWNGPEVPANSDQITEFWVNTEGTYTVQAIDTLSQCTSAVDTITVTDNTAEVVASIGGGEMITCTNPTSTLDASGSTVTATTLIYWKDSRGEIVGNDPVQVVSSAGEYTLTIVDTSNACMDTESIVIEEDSDVPTADAGPDMSLDCVNETALLGVDGNVPPNSTIEWQGPQGGILGSSEELRIEVGLPGEYILIVTDTVNSCTNQDAVMVEDLTDMPVADGGSDQLLTCNVSQIELDGSQSYTSGEGELEFSWSGPGVDSGANASKALVSSSGTYYLTVINSLSGCMSIDTVMVEEAPGIEAAIVEYMPPSCKGGADGLILIDEIMGGIGPYTVTVNGQSVPPGEQIVDDLLAGVYEVVIRDENGCDWQTDIVLEEGAEVQVDLGTEITLQVGDQLTLEADITTTNATVDSIIWTTNGGQLSCSVCPNPNLIPLTGTTVTVWVVTNQGCIATDKLAIVIEDERDFFVPNVFTPNEDGVNDGFTLYAGDERVLIEEMNIYDRWGELVFAQSNFESDDPSTGWDGSFNSSAMQPGVYVYTFKINKANGKTEILRGDVTILR